MENENDRVRMRSAELCSLLSVIGMVFFVGAVIALHFLCPEQSLTFRFLSEFALTRYGVVMTTAFLVMAGSAFLLACALHLEMKVARSWWCGPLLFALGGCSLVILAICRMDGGFGGRTITGRIHDYVSLLPFAFSAIAMALLPRRLKRAVPVRELLRLYGALLLFCLLPAGTLIWLGFGWTGLLQRIVLIGILVWLSITLLRVRRYTQTWLDQERSASFATSLN